MVHDRFHVGSRDTTPHRPSSRKIWHTPAIAAHVAFEFVNRADSGTEPVQGTTWVSVRPEVQFVTQRRQVIKRGPDSSVPESMANSLDTALHRLECPRLSSILFVGNR
jgi:hypothetical protein